MPPLLQLQKLLGKGDGGWKKSVLNRQKLHFSHTLMIFWSANCDLSQLLEQKITKGIHSGKPASPNLPVQ